MAAKILAFAGSLRVGSWNKKLLAVSAQAAGAQTTTIDLRDFSLPIFDEDLEKAEGLPANARKLKDLFLANDALLIACPEYNSSITAVLKNTIDWVSRPVAGEPPLNCFDGKVVGLIAASPGATGGMRGLVTVRSILGNIKCHVLPDQFTLMKAHEAFNEDGSLKDAKQQASAEGIGKRLAEVTGKLKG